MPCKGFTALIGHGVNPVGCLYGGNVANQHAVECIIQKAKSIITVVSSCLIDFFQDSLKSFHEGQNATCLTKATRSLKDALLFREESFDIPVMSKFEDEVVPHRDAVVTELVLFHQFFPLFVESTSGGFEVFKLYTV